jgi:hypothetical protein
MGDVAQEQLQRIPAGPHNLTAETFELIHSTMATYRFGERVDIDTIGPLPKDDYDNEYASLLSTRFHDWSS